VIFTHRHKFIVFSALLCFYGQLKAADNTEKITVTGSHIKHNSTKNMPRVSIDSDTIAALAPNSLADVLRTVPGIDIFEQGGLGGLTFLSLRGGDPNFAVIIVDGVKVNDPTNSRGGAFDLGTIDPASIKQIDIYYGSFSTIYGSDALAGVISITTHGPIANERGRASIKWGANNMLGGAIDLHANLAKVAHLSVTGSVLNKDDSSFGDAYKRKVLSSALKSTDNSDTRWQLGFYYADGQSAMFPEDSGGDRLALLRQPEKRDYTQQNFSAAVLQQINEKLNINLNSAHSERKEDIANPGIAEGVLDGVPAIDSISQYQRFDISATATYEIFDNHVIALGASLANEQGSMDSTIDFGFPVPANYTLKRDSKSIFVEAALTPFDKLNLRASARYDDAEQLSINTNRFTANYQLSETSSMSAEYSEGFKLPSFFALAHPFVGNALLKPETSKNYDVTVNKRYIEQQASIRFSLYQNTYSELVDFDPILFTNINRAKVRARGAEFYVNLQPSENIKVSGHITYNQVDTFADNVVMRRRPKWKSGMQLSYQILNNWSLLSQLTYNNGYNDSSIATGMVDITGFMRIDMSTRWKVNPDITVNLHLKNLLDDDSEQAIGFNNAGRSISLSIAKRF
jgi:vitamin B12 transporter